MLAASRAARTDAAGVVHPPAGPGARIVSLVPSITELLFDLGLGTQVVGRTGFCVHPRAALKNVPKVGGTKDVRLETLRALGPTHVIVNVEENRRETVEEIARFVPHVVVTHPLGPRDNPPLYRLMGGIFGTEGPAEHLCEHFDAALAALCTASPAWPRERVLYLIWRKPWMSVSPDTYISRTLALAGWDTWPPEPQPRYPEIDLAAAVRAVDRILLPSEPWPFRAKHALELQALLPAAHRVPVTLLDGEMTSWYGSRAVEGLRYLRELRAQLAG